MSSAEPSLPIPLPDYVVDETGTGYMIGAIGGSVIHFAKGLVSSPKGHRLAGGCTAVRMNVLRVAGSWAAFVALYTVSKRALAFARRKDDPWNNIAAGGATCGLLAIRQGALAASRHAFSGATVLAILEGVILELDRFTAPKLALPPPPARAAARKPTVTVVPRGFPGMPARAPIVVREVPVADLSDA